MESGTKKWLTGCGIGCGAVVLLAVVLLFVAGRFVSREFRGIGEAISSHEQLIKALGDVDSYAPRVDGSIPADRMQIFLEVREALAPSRPELEASLDNLHTSLSRNGRRSFREALGFLGDLGGLISSIGRYIERRNDLLLEKSMSLGEYLYIYAIAYYSWLGNSPEDGPVPIDDSGRRSRNNLFGDDSPFGAPALRRQYREIMVRFLENQAARATPEEDAGRRGILDTEIDRLKERDADIAWQDKLPQAILDSLTPYRGRLETSYSRLCNCFEWPVRNEREWREWGR
jgi:hypothetical protein